MFRKLALVSVAAFAAAPAAAQTTQTVWLAAPTAADVAAAYPEKARAAGLGGGVELMCSAARDGSMRDCDVLGESPRGQGFGNAARKLAETKMRAAGVAKGAEVRVSLALARP